MSSKYPKPLDLPNVASLPYFTIALATTEWNETGTWRYLRPRYIEQIPACQNSCPTANDIERWILLFEEGKIAEAWDAATLENPFPGIMGRVCFHPCMTGCNRRELGGAVNIQMLERALAGAFGEELPVPKPFFSSTGKRVAIIGAGPAGLASAYHLSRFGHRVTIFEKNPKAGGMLRYGIPAYRLPRNVLDREIERLVKMGIEIFAGKPIRDAAHMQELKQKYSAVFIAHGAQKSKAMGIPDEKTSGIMPGIEFLHKVSDEKPPEIGRRVLVVGGGNTAVDAARTARRLGAEVKLLYRRSRVEMPAFEEEVRQAEEEGIVIEMLVSPMRIVESGGRVTGLECQRMKLGEPDSTGRRTPFPIEGQNRIFDADAILTAIGEEIDTSIVPSALPIEHGAIKTKAGGRTEWASVFAGGDCTFEMRTVVDALGAGKRSAIAIDCHLRGEDTEKVLEKICITGTDIALMSRYLALLTSKSLRQSTTSEITNKNRVAVFGDLNPDYFESSKAQDYPVRGVGERLSGNGFLEVHLAPPGDSIKTELGRCFHCGRCTECDNCYIYCPDVSIVKKEGGFEIDHHFCKGCGVCVKECPRAAMDLIEEPTEV